VIRESFLGGIPNWETLPEIFTGSGEKMKRATHCAVEGPCRSITLKRRKDLRRVIDNLLQERDRTISTIYLDRISEYPLPDKRTTRTGISKRYYRIRKVTTCWAFLEKRSRDENPDSG